MAIRLLTASGDLKKYDAWVRARSHGNLWQSLERKTYLEAIGKEVKIYVAEDGDGITASAMVMIDKTSFGLSTWDCARGPLWRMGRDPDAEELMKKLIADARQQKCMSVFFSPYAVIDVPHWLSSQRHVHAQATRILDLTVSEDQILKQMKPKGRYNIGVAEKHGVAVARSGDIDAYYSLVQETTKRDGFIGLPKSHYKAFLDSLPGSFLLLATLDAGGTPKPVAGLLGVIWEGGLPAVAGAGRKQNNTPAASVGNGSYAPAKVGIYYYGASSYADRAVMAPYLIQWETIKLCKAAGCTKYDLLGVAPKDAPVDHPWQGITSFKEKFGGQYVEYPAEKEVSLRPMTKTILNLKRRIIG